MLGRRVVFFECRSLAGLKEPRSFPWRMGAGFWDQEEAAVPWQTALYPCSTILTSRPWFQRGSGISEGVG